MRHTIQSARNMPKIFQDSRRKNNLIFIFIYCCGEWGTFKEQNTLMINTCSGYVPQGRKADSQARH